MQLAECAVFMVKGRHPMPIPDFNSIGILPPHSDFKPGEPITPAHLSPYFTTSLELCQKLGNTPPRRQILRGWLEFRKLLREIGFTGGFQWIDGSFTEKVEATRGLPPGDIDVVSFLPPASASIDPAILGVISDQELTKERYKVHHMIIELEWRGELMVESTRFWWGLLSHRKEDGAWKGLLKIDLNTIADDVAAKNHLDFLETA